MVTTGSTGYPGLRYLPTLAFLGLRVISLNSSSLSCSSEKFNSIAKAEKTHALQKYVCKYPPECSLLWKCVQVLREAGGAGQHIHLFILMCASVSLYKAQDLWRCFLVIIKSKITIITEVLPMLDPTRGSGLLAAWFFS